MRNCKNDIDKQKQSSSRWAISCFHHTLPPQKHYIAQRTAKKWLPPLFGFGLFHAPFSALELDRKYTVVGKFSEKAATAHNEHIAKIAAVPRVDRFCVFSPPVHALIKCWEAATSAICHYVSGNRRR
jgi:hypothetical protein